MRKLLLLITAFVTSLLTACSAQPPVPEDHFYRLPDIKIEKTRQLANKLAVKRFLADGLHSERALLYTDAKNPLQIKRYHYHHWVKSPANMLQESIVSALRSSGVARLVENYDAVNRGEYTLKGKIRKFEELRSEESPAVLVDIELRLDNQSGKTVYLQDFRIKQTAGSAKPGDLAMAFGISMQHILDQFINDWQKL